MIERILNSKPNLDIDDIRNLEKVISQDELIKFQISNIIEVAKLVYLNSNQCWHQRLENNSVLSIIHTDTNDSIQTRIDDTNNCVKECPACTKSYLTYIKPISRIGLTRFIVHTFILTQSGPSILIHKLSKFKDKGIVVYKRRVGTSPTTQILTSTVMQLIASQILLVKGEQVEDTITCSLMLNVINEYGRLSYEEDSYWEGLLLV